ncbi:MAG TPA: 50S ribosomal protein L5 [Candidatus Nanoarchaeia archaeon]|nr:50S ribosomal protein L5 [Candidatus Nanoarchaeia archaeon]
MNPMKTIHIEKLTLNIGTGGTGEKLEKAVKLLATISGAKPVKTSSTKRIPTWGVRPNLAIAAKVTLRGTRAQELLKRLLQAVDNILAERKFDSSGNFSFGIDEYIKIPDVPYDITIGIIGLEVAVTLQRGGFRIKRRSSKTANIPTRHRITKQEAITFTQATFGTKIGETA